MNEVTRARFDGGLDRLSSLIERFRVSATIVSPGSERARVANFLVFRDAEGGRRLVFMPGGTSDTPLCPARAGGLDETLEVAADISISGAGHHLIAALPQNIEIYLSDAADLEAVVVPLVGEVTLPRCGGQAVFHRLCEIVVIRLLRHALESGTTAVGLLAGLAHPRLAEALVAIHETPDHAWTLEQLADQAGMSRTQFAVTFKAVVGATPGVYLSSWRLEIARTELEAGSPVKRVARMCGFSSAAAFSRAFARRYGHAPRLERSRAA